MSSRVLFFSGLCQVLSKFPRFDQDFPKFVHKIVSKESKETCKRLEEKEEEINREFIENYSVDEKYNTVMKESPVLVSVLHAASTTQKYRELQVVLYDQ